MKMKAGFKLVEIAGEYMVIPTGENIACFRGSVVLNEVGGFLLKQMEQDTDADTLLERLLDTYDVAPEQARKDLEDLLARLGEMGLTEP